MECRERYFTIAVDLSVTGEELRFEAVSKYESNRPTSVYCCAGWPFLKNASNFPVLLSFIGLDVLLLTLSQVRIMCIPSLSNTAPSMATRSKSSLFKAWWSSGHLTSALTLKTKCVQNLI